MNHTTQPLNTEKPTFKSAIDEVANLPSRPGTFTIYGKCGIKWEISDPEHHYLYKRIKKIGKWNGSFWDVGSENSLKDFLDFPQSKQNLREYEQLDESGVYEGVELQICRFTDNAGCIFSNHPRFVLDNIDWLWAPVTKFKTTDYWQNSPIIISHEFDKIVENHRNNGAKICEISLSFSPINVRLGSRKTEILCQPHIDPRHYLLIMRHGQTWEWVCGSKRSIVWDGTITISTSEWEDWHSFISTLEIPITTQILEHERVHPIQLDYQNIPGWNLPAHNGNFLHEYQREGIQFAADLGGRILNGDEMGTGKTAQSIGFANGINAKKILVLVPAIALFVWQAEIQSWLGDKEIIQCILTSDTSISEDARWIIVSYDLLVQRQASLKIHSKIDQNRLLKASKKNSALNCKKSSDGTLRVCISQPVYISGLTAQTEQKIKRVNQRMECTLLHKLKNIDFDVAFSDEAHFLKNPAAHRTICARELLQEIDKIILLTGTPIRNNTKEIAALLSILQANADIDARAICGDNREKWRNLVKSFLKDVMIRRTKKEVLKQLPPKIRQWIKIIPDLSYDSEGLNFRYSELIAAAKRDYSDALTQKTPYERDCYIRKAFGNIQAARTLMGRIKLLDGQLSSYLTEVVGENSCCIVFCAHRAVCDELSSQLTSKNITNLVVDGRTAAKDRKKAEKRFQSGEIDVFIGGIKSAGESLTLTRANLCVFIEPDWVPAAILQAEDRGHRIGQKSAGYHIVHWVTDPQSGITLDYHINNLLKTKISLINDLLEENSQLEIPKELTGSIREGLFSSLFGTQRPKINSPVTENY